jgi:hypothetical protein
MFTKTNQTAVIEGRKAYEMKVAGQLPPGVSTSIWLSEEVKIPIEELVDQLRMSLGDPKGPELEPLFRQWKQLKGYPVQNVTTIQTPKGQVVTSETLLKYQEMKIKPAEFEVPKGYALVTDPITVLEQQMAKGQGPAGIGAPLGGKTGGAPPNSAQ